MTEKQWWEHRVPFVDFKCSCPECVYDGGTDLSGVATFILNCRRFGKENKTSRFELGVHQQYLAEYRDEVFEPMVASYSGKRKTEDGRIQFLLIGHRHSFHEIGRISNYKFLKQEEIKDIQEKVIREERAHRSIPIFPCAIDPGATFELFEHAFKAIEFVMKQHGSGQPIELHVQLGSSTASTGALLHALYHYRIHKDPKVHIFTYFVDRNYDDEWIRLGHDPKLHQMILPRLHRVVPL